MKTLKQALLNKCRHHILERKNKLLVAISEISEALQSETKSSVGDKHETSRARLQSEEEKLHMQLNETNITLNEFDKINTTSSFTRVSLGALVQTNQGYFFIAVAIGKMEVDNINVFVISPISPFALAMKSLRITDCFLYNGKRYEIVRVS